MTPEQQLAAVIEAQVKGGCSAYQFLLLPGLSIDGFGAVRLKHDGIEVERIGVIEILIDPQGLRGAYGTELACRGCKKRCFDTKPCEDHEYARNDRLHVLAAYCILDAWLSEPEGDPAAAIKTAYDLLP